MIPSLFVILDELPLTANGKVDRRSLSALQSGGVELRRAYVAPRDMLELQLARIFENVLNVSPVGVHDNFFELGGHSLLAVRLFAVIEKALDKRLPVATIFQGASVEHLAGILRQNVATTNTTSLVEIQPGGSRQPLFFVHAVGGSAFSYIELANQLGPEQPFYTFQSEGLDERYKPHTQIAEMAAHYIAEMQMAQPEGPYMLGGWSMGGVVAFEMARQLIEQGHKVSLLTLIDSFMPFSNGSSADRHEDELLLSFAYELGLSAEHLATVEVDVSELGFDEKMVCLLELATRAKVLPPDIGIPHLKHLFSIYQSNSQALQQYRPQPIVCPLFYFKASEGLNSTDPARDWGALAASGLVFREAPGNHYTILRQPNVQFISEQLTTFINSISSTQITDHQTTGTHLDTLKRLNV
jgi:aspartate racemase